MKILNTVIKPGKQVQIHYHLAQMLNGSQITIPIIINKAPTEGPTVLCISGIHGDEVNGIEIVRQIISKKYNKPERGTIICIPVVNILGFLNQSREFPDGRDLNRVFPGSKQGTLANQTAYFIMNSIIPHVDYILDFHTGAENRFNYSQIRINDHDDELLELAKIFGSKFIIKSNQREKSFRDYATKQNKKVLLFEGGKSLNLDRIVTREGVQGVLRVLHHLGLRDFSEEIKPENQEPIIFKNTSWVRAKHSGLFRSMKHIGDFIDKGEILGTISDPYGISEKKITASWAGYIIGANHHPIINMGDALFHISKD